MIVAYNCYSYVSCLFTSLLFIYFSFACYLMFFMSPTKYFELLLKNTNKLALV